MMFIFSFIMITLVSLTTAALPADVQIRVTKFFVKVDTDKSGKASFAEFQIFMKGVDKDNNSQISLAEYVPYTPAGHKQMVPIFNYLDQNRKGYLDDADIKSVFHQYDVNVDGEVSLNELIVEYEAMFRLIESEVVLVTPQPVG